MLRVLHLYAGNLYGGIERLLVTLAAERARCPEMQPEFGLCFEGRLSEELRATGVPLHMLGEVKFSRPWAVWRARQRLRSLLRRGRFDVVVCHACWPHAVFSEVVRAASLPLVFWAHDVPSGTHWLERRASAVRPDLVIANSAFTQREVPKLFADARSRLLYYPVPLVQWGDEASERQQARAELDTPLDRVVVAITCRLEAWKGHLLLLSALERLAGLPGWMCWVAGGAQRPEEVEYLASLQASVAKKGLGDRVRFIGQRSDIPRILVAADIHCQPNTSGEPFGIAFVEAMAAGLPVVSTNLGAAPEIVTSDCGVLVPADDASSLAAAIEQLVGDRTLRRTMGDAGRRRAKQLCSPTTALPQLQNLLSPFAKSSVTA